MPRSKASFTAATPSASSIACTRAAAAAAGGGGGGGGETGQHRAARCGEHPIGVICNASAHLEDAAEGRGAKAQHRHLQPRLPQGPAGHAGRRCCCRHGCDPDGAGGRPGRAAQRRGESGETNCAVCNEGKFDGLAAQVEMKRSRECQATPPSPAAAAVPPAALMPSSAAPQACTAAAGTSCCLASPPRSHAHRWRSVSTAVCYMAGGQWPTATKGRTWKRVHGTRHGGNGASSRGRRQNWRTSRSKANKTGREWGKCTMHAYQMQCRFGGRGIAKSRLFGVGCGCLHKAPAIQHGRGGSWLLPRPLAR